jgi:predicted branched-subunit amino acid permease
VSDVPVWRGAAARAALRAGAADVLPTFPATMAWGLVTGVAMVQSGLSLPEAYGLAVFAFAGSAQLAALPLLTSHAPVWVTVLTALMVNLRFVIYSAALKHPFSNVSFGRRLGLSYLIGDIPFVMFVRHAPRHARALQPAYFLGIGAANFVAWHAGSFAGLVAAGRIPAEWGLDFAGMVALVALLVPMLATPGGLVGCAVAGVAAILFEGLPARAGLLVATLLGIGAALVAERVAESRR